jgi:hypothetical protein
VTAPLGTIAPAPVFTHLLRMTNRNGLFEHALYVTPRPEHGYCADDVARALVVVLREPTRSYALDGAAQTYLSFLEEAVAADGSVHNRRSAAGAWSGEQSTGDCWGRTVSALGFAARAGTTRSIRLRASRAFVRSAQARSVDVRASAFAAIGAAEFLRGRRGLPGPGESLLRDCLARIPRGTSPGWEWPEPRMRYANAALCDALIYGGAVLGSPDDVNEGIRMLEVLLEIETGSRGHLSVTGTAGRSPGESGPLWDQQPIEAAVIADACVHAAQVTGETIWRRRVDLACAWFLGANDAATVIYDTVTGAGHDGLQPKGRNQNCGAESTLAALGTVQHARAMSERRP